MNPFGFPGLPANLDFTKLVTGTGGPVNWDVARFVAFAMAGDAEAEPRWRDIEDEYTQLARAAEVQVAEYTGITASHLLTPVEVVSRARWCELHLEAFKPMMEALARKTAESQPPVAPGAEPFGNLMKALAPLMMGAHTGMLVGFLSHHVLGRYDLQVPPSGGGPLVFVADNLEAAERELNVVPRDFKFWVALYEVVRAIEYDQPGIRDTYRALAVDLVDSLQIDTEKLAGLQNFDPEDVASMQSLMEDPSLFLGGLSAPGGSEVLERMTAFIELVEGYAEHITSVIGEKGIPELDAIRSAIEEKRREREDMEDMFEQTLGFALRGEAAKLGRDFCDEITTREGIGTLNRIWSDAAARPSLEEIRHPDLWIDRTIGRRG